ncbi:M56 family metallopeptidase [Polluticaenibacter yanchengensis]|uniref:TonB-dependent receptor plug domain-containing protein n=1 Tax=Polluticaenibacter yanchengensis TaxID=3014562 RepID=A0ABT4UKU2_9BACT|nr:TonB-dependent receptor plug domain-containing protein [Chitinophagaceae bacterium LY-5]
MHPVMVYLLKMVICSSILFAYYRFALFNKKFHVWNRFYLLAITGVSILAPFIEIPILETSRPEFRHVATAMPWHIESVYIIDNNTAPAISTNTESTVAYHTPTLLDNLKQIPLTNVITFLYITICLFFFTKLLAEILRLNKLYKRSPGAPYIEKVEFVITELKNAPFSFFNRLYWRSDINPTDITGKRILKHEMVHINEKHSYDKLFMNVVLAVFWINPVFWLIRKELSMIHEFLADSQSVEEHDGDAFARMILQVVNVKHSNLTNPFFSSQIKRRLQMITTSTHSKYSYLRRIAGLALLISATFSVMLTVSKSHAQKNKEDNGKLKSKSATVKNINNTDSIFINNIYIDTLLTHDKINAIKKDSVINIRIKSATNTDSASSVDLQVATIDMDNMTRNFRAKVIGDSNQVVFVNGSVAFAGLDKKNLAELKVELSDLKDKLMFTLDSQKIVFKNNDLDFKMAWAKSLRNTQQAAKEAGRLKGVAGKKLHVLNNPILIDSSKTKFIINGQYLNIDSIIQSGTFNIDNLTANFKNSAVELEKVFADLEKNNVSVRLRGKQSTDKQPLYILNGIPIDGDISNIISDDIETVNILKDASAAALYGSLAENGAVVVTTKKGKSGQSKEAWKTFNGGYRDVVVKGYATYNSKRNVTKKLKVNKSSMTYTETTVYEDKDREDQVKTIENSYKKPYYILNGRQVDRKALNNLDPQTIRNVQVYKRENEIKRYYAPEGTDAVIVVNSRQ